jgi:O-antigen/teichoic acid export membrane protein
VSYRELLQYGLPFYPGSLTQFFGYRADVYLVALLLADPSAPLGYYSMAVSMAELVFFFPNAVATFLFPHVASSSREDSNRQVPVVSRVTLLLTAAVGLALVPVASVAIPLLVPAFGPSLPALYILLPGVVAISVGKVLGGFVSGLGRTGVTSIVSILTFAVNVILNIVLIPRYGILGASAASLVSYTVSSIAYSVIAARLTGARLTDFWVPRAADVRFALATTIGLVRRIPGRIRPGSR